MFTAKMLKLIAVVLQRDAEKVKKALLGEGVMQFINFSSSESDPLEPFQQADTVYRAQRLGATRQRIEALLRPANIAPDMPRQADIDDRTTVDIDAENARLDAINSDMQSLRDKQRALQQEIMKLEDIQRQINLYGLEFSALTSDTNYSFISVRMGEMPQKVSQRFNDEMERMPVVRIRLSEDSETARWIIISMKRDMKHIDTALESLGWKPIDIARQQPRIKDNVAKDLDARIAALHHQQKEIEHTVQTVVGKNADALKKSWLRLRVNELLCSVESYFMNSQRTIIFSGWLPADKQRSLEQQIKAATTNKCYLEWLTPESTGDLAAVADTPPVKFTNPQTLSPFQLLVANFGIPGYGTIDPTPVVTVTYLTMFGLMFADAGHGLVLALLGAAGLLMLKHSGENIRNLLSLLIWCGGSAIVFGILFGSYFGLGLFKPLWFDYHGLLSGHVDKAASVNSIVDVLAITVNFGIAVILIGLLFNWINLIRMRKWFDLIFAKGGIFGAWIFAGGIYCARFMVGNGYQSLPPFSATMALMGIPALCLLAKEPAHMLVHRTARTALSAATPLKILFEWAVEMLEIFTSYLSNTLSFMRVAGLGIAHISLMIVTFELAQAVRDKQAGYFFYALIIFVGNVFVIGLEGLSAAIQALRLNYYEFFTKFFHGTGKLYSPISLRSKNN